MEIEYAYGYAVVLKETKNTIKCLHILRSRYGTKITLTNFEPEVFETLESAKYALERYIRDKSTYKKEDFKIVQIKTIIQFGREDLKDVIHS